MSKGVGDREEGKKGGGLEREGGDGAQPPSFFSLALFSLPPSPPPFFMPTTQAMYAEMNELYLMLSFLVVFFEYLILFRLIAALQMADIKNCSTSISKKNNALYTGFSSLVRYFAKQSPLH